MLHIRPEQLESMSVKSEEQFINQLAAMAATAYPEQVWVKGAEGLRQLIQGYIAEGKLFGLSYEYSLGRYTYWRLDHGDEVLADPRWQFFRNVLQDDTMNEEDKVFKIDTLLYGAPLYPENWDNE